MIELPLFGPHDYDRWIERGEIAQPAVDLLRPLGIEKMEKRPANPADGNVRNNDKR